ncbi:MAG: hypothetical protein P1U34_01915 [Coxiellaceae bacterium]|nr:hypothetical protein [Coxiellaceae bacterium]
MSREIKAIVRQSFSRSNDDVGTLGFARDTYVASRQQGYVDGAVMPSLADINAGMPDIFKVEYAKGWYSIQSYRIYYGQHALVSPLEPMDFEYTRRQHDLQRYNRSLIYRDVVSSVKRLLDYAVERNASVTRSDVNLSFGRNRIIIWVCNELQNMVKQPANAELLRQITQLEYFLDCCTKEATVKNFYPESTRDNGANGFPNRLREVKRKVTSIKNTVKLALEMQSLGDMFQGFGASLTTAVFHLSCFTLYFSSDAAIRQGNVTFDFDEFYGHNVSSGMRVGSVTTKRGSYEERLFDSVLGKTVVNFYETLQAIEKQEPFENRFLNCTTGGRETDFRQMASYVLKEPVESLPRRSYMWSGFLGTEYFPLDLESGQPVEGDELASDIMKLFGLMIEAHKIAQQFKKGKGPASFVGDYNMVYNAHMHWAMQSLLLQWRALNRKISEITTKLDAVRSTIMQSAPRGGTSFHKNAAVMESEYSAAATALNSVDTDYNAIEERIRLLHTEGYLKKKCKEAKQFVVDASGSAETLLKAGVLTDDEFSRVERYRPLVDVGETLDVTESKVASEVKVIEALRDPLEDMAGSTTEEDELEEYEIKRGSSNTMSQMLALILPSSSPRVIVERTKPIEHGTSEELKAYEVDLATDEALLKAEYREIRGSTVESNAQHKHALVAQGKRLDVLFPLLIAAKRHGLADSTTVLSMPPYHVADFTVLENGEGIMLVDNSTNPVGVIDFKSEVLLSYYGRRNTSGELVETYDAMLGRYALCLARMHDYEKKEYRESALTSDCPRVEQYTGLQAVRLEIWQNTVAIEQALNRLQAMLTAFEEAQVLPNGEDKELSADWASVNLECRPKASHPLLADGINDITSLVGRIQTLLTKTTVMHTSQYESCCDDWHVATASHHSFSAVKTRLKSQLSAVNSKVIHLAGSAVNRRDHVTVGDLKLKKEQQYRTLRVASVEKSGPPSKRIGRKYNVAMVDREGHSQHDVRFKAPLPKREIERLVKPQQEVMREFFSGSSFVKLTKRIQSNQKSYDKYEAQYRGNKKKNGEFNYVVVGAAKAANMQAYMNVLMVRLRAALNAKPEEHDRAWESVYEWLGGPAGQVDFKDRQQRDAFLTSDKLTYRVRLRNKIGEFNLQDTEFTALTHRHGSHGESVASNFWGMRGLSKLPATTDLLLTFVKQARRYLDAHVARPEVGAHAHA